MAALPFTIAAAAEAIDRRRLSPLELVDAMLDRIRTWQPTLNCFLRVDADRARRDARTASGKASPRPRGGLGGIPLAHKDMLYRRGELSTCGSRLRTQWLATETAGILSRLDRAGAIDLGRHNMSEFAYGVTGHNEAFGDCCNPWNRDYVPGGSSSGSAAAVAARLCLGAIGSDTGGSIRAPAGICGVTGLKTTLGRVSRAGTMALSPSLDTLGPIAVSAIDCALLLQEVAGPDANDPFSSHEPVPDYWTAANEPVAGVRIGVPRAWIEAHCHSEIATALFEAMEELGKQGATVIDAEMPDIELLSTHCLLVMQAEAAAIHASSMRKQAPLYESQTRARLQAGFAIPAATYLGALHMRGASLQRFCAVTLSHADVLATPLMVRPTPTLKEAGRDSGDAGAKARDELTRLLRWVNYLGVPAMALPCGFDSRSLPIGMQFVGRPFSEPLLLRIGAAYQRGTDWHARTPPVPALG